MTSSIRCKPLFVLFAVFFAFYSVYWYLNNPRLLVLLTITISLILILGLCAAYAKEYHRLKSEWVFLALLIAFLIIFIFIFPPFTVPDEGHHFFSTYWMVDSLPFNAHVTNDGGFLVRDIDLSLYKGRQSNAIDSSSFDSIIQNYALFENGKWTPFNEFSFSVSSENVSAKIGSIVGLQIGLFFGLGAYPVFYMGRIGSALVFCFCAFQAYRIAPKGKSVIVFVSLLPMTLHLAASYSYDSGIIAYSLLVFACLMRGFFGEQKSIGCNEIVIYLIISAFLAPCKVVYSGMILLGLLVPLSQFQDVKVGRIGKCILIFAVIASVLVLRIASMSTLVSQSSDASRGQEIGRFYTLSDIIMHPKNSFEVFFRTLDSLGDFYWGSTLGYSLGWLQKNLQFPAFFMILICCLGLFVVWIPKMSPLFSAPFVPFCLLSLLLWLPLVPLYLCGWAGRSITRM